MESQLSETVANTFENQVSQNTENSIPAFEWFAEHAKFPLPNQSWNKSSSKLRGDTLKKGLNCPSVAFKDPAKIDRLISHLRHSFTQWDTRLTYAVGGNRGKSTAEIEQVYANLFTPHCVYKNGVKLDEWITVHDEAGCERVFSLGPVLAIRSATMRLFGVSLRTTFEPNAPRRKGGMPPTNEKVGAVTRYGSNSVAYLIEFKGPKSMAGVKRLLENEPSLNIDFRNEKSTGRKVMNKVVYYMHLWDADFLILTSFYETYLLEMHEHKGEKYISYSSVQTMKDSSNVFLLMMALVQIKLKGMRRPIVSVETAIQLHNNRTDMDDNKNYDEPADGGFDKVYDKAVEREEFDAYDGRPIIPEALEEDLPEPFDINDEMVDEDDDDIFDDSKYEDDDGDYEEEEEDNDSDQTKGLETRSGKKRGPPDDGDDNPRSKRAARASTRSSAPRKGKNTPKPGRSRQSTPSKVAPNSLASPRPISCPRSAETLSSGTSDRRRNSKLNICRSKELEDEGFPFAEFRLVPETTVHFPEFPTSDKVPRLVLLRRLADGHTGDVYEAKLANPVIVGGPTYAIKYVDAENRLTYERKHCMGELRNEYINYCLLQVGKRLDSYAPIINAFTPTCYGLFRFQGTTEEKFVLITEYSGHKLRTNEFSQLKKPTQRLLMESLLGIHSLGMYHGDAEGRNMVLRSLKELEDTPLEGTKRRTIKFIDFCEAEWHECRGIERCEELRDTWRDMFGNSDPSKFQAAVMRKYHLPFVDLEDLLTQMGMVNKKELGKQCFLPYFPHLYQELTSNMDVQE